jgi:DNA polymerase II small subunit/DNA polymerase delta subunit B
MERSAPAGMAAAIRLCTPETFAMTSGVIVPVDREALEEVFDEVLPRVRGSPDQVANDRRFATAIYRTAVARGLMERIGFEEIPPPAR